MLDANAAWGPILGLTAVTFLSRLAIFFGVKRLGGLQTALLGLGELLVPVAIAHWWLGDKLSAGQWIGAGILLASLGLVALEPAHDHPSMSIGWLMWIKPPQPHLPPEVPQLLAASGDPSRLPPP